MRGQLCPWSGDNPHGKSGKPLQAGREVSSLGTRQDSEPFSSRLGEHKSQVQVSSQTDGRGCLSPLQSLSLGRCVSPSLPVSPGKLEAGNPPLCCCLSFPLYSSCSHGQKTCQPCGQISRHSEHHPRTLDPSLLFLEPWSSSQGTVTLGSSTSRL